MARADAGGWGWGGGWERTFCGLLRFEMLRLRCSRGFWGWAALLGIALVASCHTDAFGAVSANTVIFVLSISIPLLCANDLDAGALKNVLVGPHSRSAYVVVILVLAVGLALGMLALCWGIAGVAAWTGWRSTGVALVPEQPGLWAVLAVLCVVSAVAPALFVAILTRSQPLATIAALLRVSDLPVALLVTWLYDIGQGELAAALWSSLSLNVQALLGSGVVPEGLGPRVVVIGTGVLFAVLSLWAMGRRDVSVCDE